MGTKYLTRPQVRQRYGNVADITIKRWINAGRIPAPLLIANRHYFPEAELDEYDRRHAAAFWRAQAEQPQHTPPQLQKADAPPKRRGRPPKLVSEERAAR